MSNTLNKTIYAIIVTYNGSKWVDKCFGSLSNSNIPLKIFAVDNQSSDNTVELIRQNYPNVHLIETGANLGFGKANNIGLKFALKEDADFAFLFNQDAWIQPDTIEKLVAIAEANQDYGIISPMHYDGGNENFDHKFIEYIQHNVCPGLLEDLWFKRMQPIYETTFVNCAAWLVPKKCFQLVGGFDPLFPHYGEDTDYVQRVQFNKFKIGITPSTIINHDSRVQLWEEIKWNKKRMFTIYLSEVKNINGSLRSNMLVFLKNQFNDTTSNLLFRQFKMFMFKIKLVFKIIFAVRSINQARKNTRPKTAFLQ